ncbi:aspartate carbamoyltransferase, partial [bacterium]|nr:aspartate carbamoyltransferase [bacterium]
VHVVSNIDDVIPSMDFINVLRIQYERQDLGYFPTVREYRDRFGITQDRLNGAKTDLCILHPGPINRGIEIDSSVADGPNNVILDQVTNGVIVRMAILDRLLSPSPKES